jgi:hypothetical protein
MTLRGLGQTPLVLAFAQAIAQMEGFNTSGSIAQRNNNPGNLRSGPNQNGTANGYATYATPALGWADLYSQIQTNFARGLNTYQFFGGGLGYPGYAPTGDSNTPNTYAVFVAGQLGIDPNVPLNSLDPTTFAGSAPVNAAATPLLCADGSLPLADGSCDDSSVPGSSVDLASASVVSTSASINWTYVGIGVGVLLLWMYFRD